VVLIVLVGVLPRLTAQPDPVDQNNVAQATLTSQAPATVGPAPEPTISGCGEYLNPDVPRVLDETGLVEQCIAWHITSAASNEIAVTNPNGDESELEVSWDGSRCEDFTSLTFRRNASGRGYDLKAETLARSNDFCESLPTRRGVHVYLRDAVAASTVNASLGAWAPGTGPPTEKYAPPLAELVFGSWKLSAEAHPTTHSTELSILVFDPDCSAGLRDPGQVQDPVIMYTPDTISVTIPVLKVRRPECSAKA